MSKSLKERASLLKLLKSINSRELSEFTVNQVVTDLCEVTNASRTMFCRLSSDGEMVDYAAVAGDNAFEILGMRVRASDTLSSKVIQTEQNLLILGLHEVETGDLFSTASEESTTPLSSLGFPAINGQAASSGSAIVVPVTVEGKLIGTLAALRRAGSKGQAAFEQSDIDLVALYSQLLSVSLEREQENLSSKAQSRELAVLYSTTLPASDSLNVQEVMNRVIDAIFERMQPQTASIFLINDENTHLFIAASRGLSQAEQEIQLAVESSMVGRVLNQNQPRVIPDTELEYEFQDVTTEHARSAVLACIEGHNGPLGLLMLTSHQKDAFGKDDIKLLQTVGMQTGIAIENAWLYEDAQRKAVESAALYELSQQLGVTLDLNIVSHTVVHNVKSLLEVDRVMLLLFDDEKQYLVVQAAEKMDPELLSHYTPGIGEGIAGWVYEWQTPQAVSDISADSRNHSAPIQQFGSASVLCVPLQVGEDTIGVIQALNDQRRLFTVAEMELLYTIANQASIAIMNASRYREMRARAQHMRRYFRRVAEALGKVVEPSDLPQQTVNLVLEMMRADRCTLYRVGHNELELVATSGFRASNPPDRSIPFGTGLAGWVWRRAQSLSIEQTELDVRTASHPWMARDHVSSYLGIPLRIGRQTVGVLEVYTQDVRIFAKDEIELVVAFARRARLTNALVELFAGSLVE